MGTLYLQEDHQGERDTCRAAWVGPASRETYLATRGDEKVLKQVQERSAWRPAVKGTPLRGWGRQEEEKKRAAVSLSLSVSELLEPSEKHPCGC